MLKITDADTLICKYLIKLNKIILSGISVLIFTLGFLLQLGTKSKTYIFLDSYTFFPVHRINFAQADREVVLN